MVDAPPPRETGQAQKVRAGLRRRHRAELRFRGYGIAAIVAALSFVAILFGTIMVKGVPAFWQPVATLDVLFDPEIITVGERPERQAGQSENDYLIAIRNWERNVATAPWNRLIEEAVRAKLPPGEYQARDLTGLIAGNERFKLRDMFLADSDILGRTVTVNLLADANVDVWLKGNIDRTLPDSRQQLSATTRAIADSFYEDGTIDMKFTSTLFFSVDSRSSPANAGLAGAFVGSLFMMLVVVLLAVPIGVASAIYLEEFAPKNRLTDLIEVNINNLAAVPSIVFGLLGAAVFINTFHLPLSAPIAGGLVLTLMTLPTIIIATRAALKAVPPSIRQAALGLGASRVQTVFHHVLPLTAPGILTATIIGVAQALGETAPLLLIGMSAFVAAVPATPFDPSTALPVQIFLWQGNENRNFFEPRTSAAILVLLGLMILMNAVAIFLRQRFERRW
ncbi:MAG: phosphate ABC transporter permease PstA [Bauldia sp.]|nr:phosphate ABC transporter permease PstA [Bauldia sp.]